MGIAEKWWQRGMIIFAPAVVGAAFLGAACAPHPAVEADSTGPEEVRVQTFNLHDYRNDLGGKKAYCVVVTHDSQPAGVSIGLWCNDHN